MPKEQETIEVDVKTRGRENGEATAKRRSDG